MDAFWTKTLAQRLKFPKAVISLQHLEVSEISISYALFLTNYHRKRQIFQVYWCRVKRPVQNSLRLSCAFYAIEIAKVHDQSDKREND